MLDVMRDTINEVLDGEHAAPRRAGLRWATQRCAVPRCTALRWAKLCCTAAAAAAAVLTQPPC